MNINYPYKLQSLSPDDTYSIGKKLGSSCRGGEIFLLTSDLGGGKTALTKGLVAGAGSSDVVSSPTFTISNIYECSDGKVIYHFDFYRLSEPGLIEYELQEIIDDPKVVIVIEWGGIVDQSLPASRIDIKIDRIASGEDHRSISVNFSDKFSYIKEALGADINS